MRLACVFLTLSATLAATEELAVRTGVPLKASLNGQMLVLNDVFLNGDGPYRMLVDTGNASSIIRPAIASHLNLKATYAVEQVSASGVRRVPVAILGEVRTGSIADRSVEVMITDVFQQDVDGVLGQSWLIHHDYLLDYRNRRIVLDGPPTGAGVRVPLLSTDGRPMVTVLINGRPTELVVDSGASALVLYEKPAFALSAFHTNGGSGRGQRCTVRLSLSGTQDRIIGAFRIDVSGLGAGVLPANAFRSVFVSNREGFVEFGR